jgi:predicted RND superfamily exporter protein
MTTRNELTEQTWVERLAANTIRYRWIVITGFFIVAVLAISGLFKVEQTEGGYALAPDIRFDSSYRIFFSEDNPQLQAFDALQNIYTKDDNVMIVLTADKDSIYEEDFLEAVQWLTTQGWQVPYSRRVDSITNFQNSVAVEDDLFVTDLVPEDEALDRERLDAIREAALAEPAIYNRIINDKGHATGINITVTLPGLNDMTEVPEVVNKIREIELEFEARFPGIEMHKAGVVMLNNAFSESAMSDMGTVMLPMFVVIFLIMAILLRSFFATAITGAVVMFSIVGAMGMMGWYGYNLSTPIMSAPVMIMTLAVADSIHIFITFFLELRRGKDRDSALVESLRINFSPVLLTSVTTAIGFMSMNFSDSPPFQQLGNVVATGVMIAWAVSIFFLPAVVSLLPFKSGGRSRSTISFFDAFSSSLARHRGRYLVGSVAVVVFLGAMVPRIDLNDQWVKYFDESMEFRQDADYAEENLTGMNNFEFSLPAATSGGINDPEYLEMLESFATWYRARIDVVQVNSIADIMKRLNKNMHGDDQNYYRIPESRELAAQYLLLYEFSLPYGLDLNNQINVDKSASRITITTRDVPTKELRKLIEDGEIWLRENAPYYMHVNAASPTVMFAHISERNIKSMLGGTFVAVLAISLLLGIALKSVRFGLISLIPNITPAVLGFGFWSLLYGEMGLSLAMVSGMTLGIVVDDTVHFLSKYLRARREKGLDGEEAVRYAFQTVGKALVVTTIILTIGFFILGMSSFRMNSWMGQLTAIVIAFALIADFILLPAFLLVVDGKKNRKSAQNKVLNEEAAIA